MKNTKSIRSIILNTLRDKQKKDRKNRFITKRGSMIEYSNHSISYTIKKQRSNWTIETRDERNILMDAFLFCSEWIALLVFYVIIADSEGRDIDDRLYDITDDLRDDLTDEYKQYLTERISKEYYSIKEDKKDSIVLNKTNEKYYIYYYSNDGDKYFIMDTVYFDQACFAFFNSCEDLQKYYKIVYPQMSEYIGEQQETMILLCAFLNFSYAITCNDEKYMNFNDYQKYMETFNDILVWQCQSQCQWDIILSNT